MVQSGWIAKVLPLQVGCINKVTNLLYIYETCEIKKEISCDGLYNDATGEAKVANSDYTIKELVFEVKEEKTPEGSHGDGCVSDQLQRHHRGWKAGKHRWNGQPAGQHALRP